MDGFVFTAGIGENAPAVRRSVANRLSWIGVRLSEQANEQNALRISSEGSRVGCYVVPTDEELMIATHTLRILRKPAAEPVEEKRA
jgi:acetate kinase